MHINVRDKEANLMAWPACSVPPPKGVARKYLGIALKLLHKKGIVTYEEMANAFRRLRLKAFHNHNQPPPLNPAVLAKGPWPSIAGSHREMETRLSVFPLAIAKCARANTAFQSKPYELIKVDRACYVAHRGC